MNSVLELVGVRVRAYAPRTSASRFRVPGARTIVPFLLALILSASSASLPAQEPDDEAPPSSGELAVFLDCQTGPCDTRYFRTEITFVDWIRIREEGDVHVILTSQGLGGGARQYQADFIGQGPLSGVEDELVYNRPSDATQDETLEGISRILSVGLARFATLAGAGGDLRVVGEGRGDEDEAGQAAGPEDDPWNLWVFNVGANGSYEEEERQSEWELRGRLSADRTTEDWRLRAQVGGQWQERQFETGDSVITDPSRDWDGEVRGVYSLADHWSVAGALAAGASTFVNQDLSVQVGTGIEYSLFPYPEATRRQVAVRYLVYGRHFEYEDSTIFGHISETRPQHLFEVAVDFRQPWGEAGIDLEASQYLHDTARRRLTADGDVSFRIYRGLSLNFEASASQIRDQLFLPAEDLSPEEILLERRQLATEFEYELEAGFSFSFGSIYNNVVNNRFRRGFF